MIPIPPTLKKDLTGQQFGHLIVLGAESRSPRGIYTWRCKCSCDKERLVRGYHLTLKKVRSCGCQTRQTTNIKYHSHEFIGGWMWSAARTRARRSNIPFNITTKDMWEAAVKQDMKCALTGVPLVFVISKTGAKSGNASLDRIDSSLGYEVGNIQWTTKWSNFAKTNLTTDQFVDNCILVVAHNPR